MISGCAFSEYEGKILLLCSKGKVVTVATDCPMKPKVSFEEFDVSLPSKPPSLTPLRAGHKGTDHKSPVCCLMFVQMSFVFVSLHISCKLQGG